MKKILFVLPLFLSLLFVSFASAAPAMPIPATQECMTLFKKSGFMQEGELWSKEQKEMMDSGCLNVNPYKLTQEDTENWDTAVCQTEVPLANNMVSGINLKALNIASDKAYSKASKTAEKAYQARIDKNNAWTDRLVKKLDKFIGKNNLNKKQKQRKAELKTKLRAGTKQMDNIWKAIDKKIENDPAYNKANKAFNEGTTTSGYAILAMFADGCLLDPSLNNIYEGYTGLSNKNILHILQDTFGQTSHNIQQSYEGKMNTIYKALKSYSVDSGKFRFSAERAVFAINQSEGKGFAKVGGAKEILAGKLDALYVRTKNNGHKVCVSVGYKENGRINYLTGTMTTNGIDYSDSLNCKWNL